MGNVCGWCDVFVIVIATLGQALSRHSNYLLYCLADVCLGGGGNGGELVSGSKPGTQ